MLMRNGIMEDFVKGIPPSQKPEMITTLRAILDLADNTKEATSAIMGHPAITRPVKTQVDETLNQQ